MGNEETKVGNPYLRHPLQMKINVSWCKHLLCKEFLLAKFDGFCSEAPKKGFQGNVMHENDNILSNALLELLRLSTLHWDHKRHKHFVGTTLLILCLLQESSF